MNNPLIRDFVLYIVVSCAFLVPHRYAMRLAGVFQFKNTMNVHIMTTIENKGRSRCKKVVVGQHEDKKDEAGHR